MTYLPQFAVERNPGIPGCTNTEHLRSVPGRLRPAAALALSCSIALASCATVTTTDIDGQQRTAFSALAVKRDVCSGKTGAVVKVQSLGASSLAGHTSIGLSSAEFTCLHSDCQVVFMVSSKADFDAIADEARQISGACVYPTT